MRWTELGLGWVVCGESMVQSRDLGQVLQLEWVIVGGIKDVVIIEACLSFLGDPTLGTCHVFVVCVSRKVSLIKSSECGCLSHHVTIIESLGPYLWAV